MDIQMCRKIIKTGGLFEGIDEMTLPRLLSALRCRHARFESGDVVVSCGERVLAMGYVLSGAFIMSFTNADGQEVILRVMHPGDDFHGEMAYLGEHTNPFTIRADKAGEVLFLDVSPLRQAQDLPCGRQLMVNLTGGFAKKNIDLYMKAELYSQKRIRSRVMLYLMSQPHPDDVVTLPLNRTEMAAYLGVDRTALARELTRMQSDGLIEVRRQQIRLLDRSLFLLDG